MSATRVEGVIFDLDGTLLDTNEAHVAAWVQGFRAQGLEISAARVRPEVGQGGDLLVPALIGDAMNRIRGDAIRDAVAAAFRDIAQSTRFTVFDGVLELLGTLRDREIRLALATSSQDTDLDLMMASAGVDLRTFFDTVVTRTDVDVSKPHRDVVMAALEKLALAPSQCIMVGDTEYDVRSASAAGVSCVGVLTAGVAAPEELRERLEDAGAVAVYENARALLRDVDEWLRLG